MTADLSAEIVVVIVNYTTAELAIEAVESVLRHPNGGRTVEVHVVDNGSPGDDAAQIARAHSTSGWGDRVTLYSETINHGFGRGNNLVLKALDARAALPDKIFFLNPDALLENDAIEILASVLDARPDVAVVGSGLVRAGSGHRVSGAFRFPSPMSEFAETVNFGPITRIFRRWSLSLDPDRSAGPVDWVSGAAFMARFSALRSVGFFDSAFFLYFEEIDLMRRLTKAGWTIWYQPEARVVHVSGAATDIDSGKRGARPMPAYWFDSWRIYFSHHYGRGGALAFAGARLLGWALNGVLRRLFDPGRPAPQRFGQDFWALVVRPLAFGARDG